MAELKALSDEELFILLGEQDDRAAFTEIYYRYWDILLDTAFQRLKSAEAAEEIVQELFVDFYLRRGEIQLKSTLIAYLKTALKYKVFNIYRSQQVHYRHLGAVIEENNIAPVMPDEILEAKELRDKIRAAAGKMPDKCREVFLMSRFDHLSHRDIASRMDISVSTVKKHITKAMGIMRAEFQGHELDLLGICILIGIIR